MTAHRDFVDLLARAPTLAAALALAFVALGIAILVMPIDEEVPTTRAHPTWPVAVFALAVANFVVGLNCLWRDED